MKWRFVRLYVIWSGVLFSFNSKAETWDLEQGPIFSQDFFHSNSNKVEI